MTGYSPTRTKIGSSEIRGVNRIRNVIGFLSNPHLVAANVLRAYVGYV